MTILFCKGNANERNESSSSNCRMQLTLCKGNAKIRVCEKKKKKFHFSER